MNYKYLLNAIATALVAAAESFQRSAEACPDGAITSTLVEPAAIANAELDADGLPWDERIHAGTKTKTQKGAWTQKKGVDATVRDAVLAELRQMYPAPTAVTPAPPGPSVPPVATSPTLPTISLPVAPTPYTKLVDWLAKNTGAGKALTDEWVKSVFESNELTLAQLAPADKHPLAEQYLEAFRNALAGTGVAEVA